ncbi:efflux RND transporter periplasmic adaptor subunit [Trichlorobacter ammonificans]|uniref:HlyD_D23 domain-containing protein n=1 Tax=Trichlorobacter ammonificans TaxID=2916410 RepID=A0ABM9D4S5_9BACT|nr:efflux RND transporter periplasmic adaptor subunit [Trichlorobacter ammonificans]CAH2030257.1 HlyD_D23 domain-containing protein [Trichlorobacter ammonificans]
MRQLSRLFFILMMTVAVGCSSSADKHAKAPAAADEPVQVTAWTAKSELFMEYAPLQPGKKSRFLIHLTRLVDGKPVTEGPLKLELHPATGQPLTFSVPAPVRPGIFEAELSVPEAGVYALEAVLEGKTFSDRITVSGIRAGAPAPAQTVKKEEHTEHAKPEKHDDHAPAGKNKHSKAEKHDDHDHADTKKHGKPEQHDDHDHGEKNKPAVVQKHDDHDDHDDHGHDGEHDHHAPAQVSGDGSGSISLSKVQQWSLDILMRQPEKKKLAGQIIASGELVAAADGEATVAAPLSGLLSVTRPLPYLGKRVAKGEVIALIEPPIRPDGGAGQLSAAHAEARNRVTLARQEHERAQRLYDAKIAPRKRVEEAAAALDNAKAALAPLERSAALLGGDGAGRLAVRAPVSGTVVELFSGTGKGIEAGQPIARIVNTATLWLKTSLPAIDAGRLPRQPVAGFTVAGQEGSFKAGRLVSVSGMLDPQSRTLPVIFSVPNPDARLKVGMFATVAVSTGSVTESLVLPAEALTEDEGRYFVFLQTAGERFTRREVQTGARRDGLVQIVKGLREHDRVVVKGSYYVKQAVSTGAKEDPHAGHAH